MKDRGEKNFIKLPKFAARLYDSMMQKEPMRIQRVQIAKEILNHIKEGKLLDVGTGHGRLLAEIHRKNPKIELYGIDISEKMINVAKINLKNIEVNLERRNIRDTNFKTESFDLITSTGSLYLWNSPIDALNEIHRILKPGGLTLIFETHKEYDKKKLKKIIKFNLKKESFFNRKFIPFFLRKQLKMTYDIKEVREIVNNSLFKSNFSVKKINLANLPIWLKLELRK